VLAVVSSGLYLSFRATEIFSHSSRLQTYAVWSTVGFVLNALVFILIGLQLRTIIQNFEKGELPKLVLYGVVISIVGLIIRLLWTIPATLLPRILSRKIRETEEFDKRFIFIFSWAGMKGIVSMAAALSIPLLASNGTKFPLRAEIIFITFIVILFSLLVQGVTLPLLVKKLKLPKYSVLAEEFEVRLKIMGQTTKYIEQHLDKVDDGVRERLLSNYKLRYQMLEQSEVPDRVAKGENPATTVFNQFGELQLQLLQRERDLANSFRKEGKTSEEVLRKIEREIDLEEGRLRLELYQD
ncbi:MAG: cation:proton antiporter, partial [Flavitalea sp.]